MTDRNRARILIVEDESLVAADLADRLRELGYEVPAVADSADEAIAKAIELEPDLVLMDIQLIGDKDGKGRFSLSEGRIDERQDPRRTQRLNCWEPDKAVLLSATKQKVLRVW